jgi:formyltetrahydrofolate deformylase
MKKVLLAECPDEPGLIAKITNLCFEHKLNIIRNDEFVDRENHRFFMRTALQGDFSNNNLVAQLAAILPEGSSISLKGEEKAKVVLLATKEAHCLGGVLLKCFENAMNVEIQAVIANYPDLEPLVKGFDIPFYCISHEGLTREQHDAKVAAKINQFNPDLIGLAKYMRILSPEFVAKFSGKIINIHHSFLPAFVGAKPYHQAFERGVKIIGATSHFVTEGLDEGPIIEQDVLHINHSYNAKELSDMGKDVEQLVFSKAIKYVTEDRVFVHKNKTVVFK